MKIKVFFDGKERFFLMGNRVLRFAAPALSENVFFDGFGCAGAPGTGFSIGFLARVLRFVAPALPDKVFF